MKIAVFALACFLSSFVSAELDEAIDWHQIKPLNADVEPTGPPAKDPGLRVIGGNEAAAGQFPYQLLVIIDNYEVCGGSLISPTAALTAAHCVDNATTVRIIAGAHNKDVAESSQVTSVVSSYIVHSEYNPDALENDIAVLKFSALPLNDRIQVIALAPANLQNITGETVVLSGWGKTSDNVTEGLPSTLRFIELPVLSDNACAIVDAKQICTSGEGRHGACFGDSGGPLVWNNSLQVGLVSSGDEHCEAGNPSIFTSVSFFRNWISENAGV